MGWTRIRWTLAALGISLTLLGLLPIGLWVIVVQSGGGKAVLVGVAALVLTPLLFLLRLGPLLVLAAWKARAITVLGRHWGKTQTETIDGRFER